VSEGDVDKTIVGAVAAVLAVCGLTAGAAAAAPAQRYPGTPQRYPGTVTRPVLSPAEAASRPARAYLAYAGSIAAPTIDPWNPRPIRTDHVVTHFVVGPVGTATYETVQQAVNAAVRRGGAGRSYIKVLPGTYRGAVLVPAGAPPITLYGAGSRPARVSIELSLDATMSPAAYAATVNPAGQYAAGDPAWEMYNSCASKTTATVGSCASVLWSQSADFQLSNLTVRNTLLDSVDSGTHQAIAVRTDGDRAQLERVRLISRQDTAYFNTAEVGTIGRVYVRDSYFEGDTDFVYGRASAIFDHSSFHLVSSRKPANGVIFAPSTDPAWRYGFLVRDSRITADAGYQAAATGHLGRAWDAGAGATGYLPGSSPNGQCLIRNSYLGAGFDPVAPWAPAATTARPFVADLSPDRTLDDPAFNRLWEYRNYGPGASVE
jgi:pectinesterase